MRILFLSTWFPYPSDNGSKIRIRYLVHALGQRHDVTLLSFIFGKAQLEGALDTLGCQTIKTVDVNPFIENQTGAFRRTFSLAPVAFRPIKEMQELASDVLEENELFDVVISSTELMAPYALQVQPEIPKVLEEHNSLTRLMRERYENSHGLKASIPRWLGWQKMRSFETRLFRHFNLITAVSDQDAQEMTSMLPRSSESVEIVPNGIDCQYNRFYSHERQAYRLIFNGALTYSANLVAMQYFLSEIFPLIRQSLPDARITITGSITGVDLSHLAIDEAVHFTKYVQDIRIPVSQATVCVVPLRSGGGTRLKILEAMALGTPIVATSKGAEGLAVVDGEHLLLADTAKDFATATIKLLSEPELRATMAANARRLVVEQYDWQQIGGRFVQLVEQAAATGFRQR